MASTTRRQNDIKYFDTNTPAELWDKRRSTQLLHAAKPPDKMTSPNSSQDQPPAGPDSGTTASNGTDLVHQRLWKPEGHPMWSPQPAAEQTHMAQPVRTTSTAAESIVPPSNAYGPLHQAVGGVSSSGPATEIHDPVSPVSNGAGPQSPSGHISSTSPSMHGPTNQASLQSPGLWAEAPSETTYFLPQSPPRSNSSFSRTDVP